MTSWVSILIVSSTIYCCCLIILTRYCTLSVEKVLGRASRQVWYNTPKRPRNIDLNRSPSPCRSLIHSVVGILALSSVSTCKSRWANSSIPLALTSVLGGFFSLSVFWRERFLTMIPSSRELDDEK